MWDRMIKWFKGVWAKIRSGLEDGMKALSLTWSDREARGRVGYYAALALLLVLLGTGSYAYRQRRQAVREVQEQPPRPVAAMRFQTSTPEPEPTAEPVRWVWPLEGEIVGQYSPDNPVWSRTLEQWQAHPALDISGAPGEAVYACRDGSVSDAWSDRLWGNVVVLEHDDGYRSTYAGLNTLAMVSVGDAVEAGQVIGSVGDSAACEADLGWHIHFLLERNGEPVEFERLCPGREGH